MKLIVPGGRRAGTPLWGAAPGTPCSGQRGASAPSGAGGAGAPAGLSLRNRRINQQVNITRVRVLQLTDYTD
eukprot:2923810-Pyramimonas_sp.AAC.1